MTTFLNKSEAPANEKTHQTRGLSTYRLAQSLGGVKDGTA